METIAIPGKNCWRRAKAGRAAFLVDAASYFTAFEEAAQRARHSIVIIGWDIDSRLRLHREEQTEDTERLVDFLNRLVTERRSLHIYILIWDFSMIYTFEREPLLAYKLEWRTHRQIEFCFDRTSPLWASHHQKVVVIDNSVAFSGGLDLTIKRWDTPAHLPRDYRRADPSPNSHPHKPFHDIQMLVDGEAAAALGELARERWYRSTSRRLPVPHPHKCADAWPPGLAPDMEDVSVAIARTDPVNSAGEIREVEKLYLDSIASAGSYIYLETQYLTSMSIGNALGLRLQERDGPEVVLVVPRYTSGWLERSTMDILRASLIKRLKDSDRFGRLRLYYPVVSNDAIVAVHSKVMISDDRLVRIGSANLSNRSMGVDSECDLVIEAMGEERVSRDIRKFRNRLLSEHLEVSEEQVDQTVNDTGSLVKGIERLRRGGRSLVPLTEELPEWVYDVIAETTVFDPNKPLNFQSVADDLIIKDLQSPGNRKRLVLFLAVIIFLMVLGLIWRFTSLREFIAPSAIIARMELVKNSPWAPAILMGIYVIGGIIMFPITAINLVTYLTFGPAEAMLYAMSGSLLSASITYGLGEWLGRNTVRHLAGKRMSKISQKIARQGIPAMVALRILPVAPFTMVNLICGTFRIRFRDYFIGTMIGMSPGIFAGSILGYRLVLTLLQPSLSNLGILAAFLLLAAIIYSLIKLIAKQS